MRIPRAVNLVVSMLCMFGSMSIAQKLEIKRHEEPSSLELDMDEVQKSEELLETWNCPFIRRTYRCRKSFVEKNWKSCCESNSCPMGCSDGILRENEKILMIGNSYVRELSQEKPVQQSIELMSGSDPRPLVTWTYERSIGLIDEDGNVQSSLWSDGPTLYLFSNNAVIYTAMNTPLILIPFKGFENYLGLEILQKLLGFHFNELTGIVASGGNLRSWAYNAWCKEEDEPVWNRPPLGNSACHQLQTYSKTQLPIVELDHLFTLISHTDFKGRLVYTGREMRGNPTPSPLSDEFLATLPYSAQYVDYATFLKDRLCKAPRCSLGDGHMCIPGPPDDGGKIILQQLRGQ